MAAINTKSIRNVVLLGHGGSGKTSIAEAALYLTKATDRLGKTTAGNTVCDYDPEEIKRGFSLNLSMAPVMWNDIKINFIDTPGYLDFVGEVEEALTDDGGHGEAQSPQIKQAEGQGDDHHQHTHHHIGDEEHGHAGEDIGKIQFLPPDGQGPDVGTELF